MHVVVSGVNNYCSLDVDDLEVLLGMRHSSEPEGVEVSQVGDGHDEEYAEQNHVEDGFHEHPVFRRLVVDNTRTSSALGVECPLVISVLNGVVGGIVGRLDDARIEMR